MMEYILIAACMVIGLIFWLFEIFLLPGVSFGAVFGTIFLGGSVWFAFANLGLGAAFVVLIINLLLLALGIYFFVRSRALDKLALDTVLPGKALDNKEDEVAVGDTGRTSSRLAPYGKAVFNNKTIEVKSSNAIIENNVEVRVVSVVDNVVTVEPMN